MDGLESFSTFGMRLMTGTYLQAGRAYGLYVRAGMIISYPCGSLPEEQQQQQMTWYVNNSITCTSSQSLYVIRVGGGG